MGAGGKKYDSSHANTSTTATGETAPLVPHMTSVNYGPLVAQAIKKRFGRNQTILGAGLGNKTLLGG